jgi:hypothetical protein
MAFINRLQGEILSDYHHASDVFRDGGRFLGTPKYKWSFHVNFESSAEGNIGLAVKTVKLPGYQIMAETLNQYNRPRIIQKKIKYNPVEMSMHDDYAGVSRALWSKYSKFYYADGPKAKAGPNNRDIYRSEANLGWGYTGPWFPFINKITIYSMFSEGSDKKWHSYELINPVITRWDHDIHSYAETTGVMENKLTIEYESVVYKSGTDIPPGYPN